MKTGIYIHIPFCVKKCLYCDFVSFESRDFQEYFNALEKEIEMYKEILSETEIDSIFIGGGTPSCVPYKYITDILGKLDHKEDAEVTIEVNPGTLDSDKIKAYRDAGINRISVGMQSANDNELKALGRIHNNYEFLKMYELIRNSGFDNINLDIMFGIPEQTVESFKNTLNQVYLLQPTHISAYSLIIEEKTPFYSMELDLPDEDSERSMYREVVNNKNGYERYEISNFCHKGFECRHNLKYWRFMPFLGFGLGAYSFYDSERYNNLADMKKYLDSVKSAKKPVAFREKEDINELIKDYIITGMRLRDGISKSEFKEKFDISFEDKFKNVILKYVKDGYLKNNGDHICFSDKGFEISNYILKDFI